VEAAGNVGRSDAADDLGVAAQGVTAEGFAHIAVQIDCHFHCLIPCGLQFPRRDRARASGAADEVAHRPIRSTAGTLLGQALVDGAFQRIEDRLARAVALCVNIATGGPVLPGQFCQVGSLGFNQVVDDGGQLSPTAAGPFCSSLPVAPCAAPSKACQQASSTARKRSYSGRSSGSRSASSTIPGAPKSVVALPACRSITTRPDTFAGDWNSMPRLCRTLA